MNKAERIAIVFWVLVLVGCVVGVVVIVLAAR